jgi:hypothetical protein
MEVGLASILVTPFLAVSFGVAYQELSWQSPCAPAVPKRPNGSLFFPRLVLPTSFALEEVCAGRLEVLGTVNPANPHLARHA